MILYRWIHGRQAEVKQSARNLNWRQLKSARENEAKERSRSVLNLTGSYDYETQLSDHRVDTCVALSLPATINRAFMNPACTSDTEEDDEGNLYRMHCAVALSGINSTCSQIGRSHRGTFAQGKGSRYVQRTNYLNCVDVILSTYPGLLQFPSVSLTTSMLEYSSNPEARLHSKS
ncbi:hypothetical protein KEM48_007691 [Puccinia striiformis f. sp. tritici PST-130]|nr:hypothetical protein KEM48_007691 [Puccinia striiformis f. sp. tritici PST-130]